MEHGDDPPRMHRVASNDGTEIAYWTSGEGPPLVLVHGTTASHTTWEALLPHLEPHCTVHAVDRRGRGASGDGPGYHLAREFEDVAAVVDAVAESSGSTVDVLGHSFGGLCAFGAALLTGNVRRLVLYEGWPLADPGVVAMPRDVADRLDVLLEAGEDEAALELFYRAVVGMSDSELDTYRSSPVWTERVATARTITREDRAVAEGILSPGLAAAVTVPVLLLVGSDSSELLTGDYEAVAAALPDARVSVLDGQAHLAHRLAPQLLAGQVLAFLREGVTGAPSGGR